MSLINELRGIEPKVEEDKGYNPLFLTVIKRQGSFIISEQTLMDEKLVCWEKEGIDFYTWLKRNKLKIDDAKMKGYFKIYS